MHVVCYSICLKGLKMKELARKYSNPAKRTIQERVRKSALLLDSEFPNWHKHISVDKLEMGSPSKCICGQLEDVYGESFKLDSLNIGRGFYNPFHCSDLKPLWVHQIKKRKQVDAMFRV